MVKKSIIINCCIYYKEKWKGYNYRKKCVGLGISAEEATHSGTLAWKIPWTEESDGLQSMRLLRVGYDWTTSLSFSVSCVGEGNGNRLQYPCLENPMDRGARRATVHGVAKSRTRLSNFTFFHFHFVWYEDCYSSLLLLPICMKYIFPSSHFQSLCVIRSEVGFL